MQLNWLFFRFKQEVQILFSFKQSNELVLVCSLIRANPPFHLLNRIASWLMKRQSSQEKMRKKKINASSFDGLEPELLVLVSLLHAPFVQRIVML